LERDADRWVISAGHRSKSFAPPDARSLKPSTLRDGSERHAFLASRRCVVGDRAPRRESGEILADLHGLLHDELGQHHLTIQNEPRDLEEPRYVPPAGF
jgi:hypothetical protein